MPIETTDYVENNFIEDDDESTKRIKTVYNLSHILINFQESDVVEIGTTKGENKESFLERQSEMNKLPDFQNNDVKDSVELPSQEFNEK